VVTGPRQGDELVTADARPKRRLPHSELFRIQQLLGKYRRSAPTVCNVLSLVIQPDPSHVPWTIASLAEACGFGSPRYGARAIRSALRAIEDLGFALVDLEGDAVSFRLAFANCEELHAIVLRAVEEQASGKNTGGRP
jgi:hypothetical protein